MLNYTSAFLLLLLAATPAAAQEIAIVGGTVIDNEGWGRSTNDIVDSVVIIRGDRIVAVGTRDQIEIPEGTHIIDARGKYILPGLIDSFAVLNNQSYANAFLYSGVTSIVGVWGGRRGPLFEDADPGPTIFKLEGVGTDPISTEALIAEIEKLAKTNHKVVLLMYSLTPEQLKIAIDRAHALGMSTIAELATTRYRDAMNLGIDAFVHTTRYSLDAAPRAMAEAIATQPFSDDLDSAKWKYYTWLSDSSASDQSMAEHAAILGEGKVPLIPTMSLLYLDGIDNENPWNDPIAAILDPADINNPADRKTGKHTHDEPHMKAYAALAEAEIRIEKRNYELGCRFLAGSGTDVWGTMPGISIYTELKLLSKIGLTNRELIASATLNTATTLKLEKVGSIKSGNFADIIILDRNPLLDIANIKSISSLILRGQMLERESLLKMNNLPR